MKVASTFFLTTVRDLNLDLPAFHAVGLKFGTDLILSALTEISCYKLKTSFSNFPSRQRQSYIGLSTKQVNHLFYPNNNWYTT